MRASNPMPRVTMDRPLATRIVDHAAELGVSALSITGGEPLLRVHDVQFLVRRATNGGIRHTRTGTNGFVFSGSTSRTFASRMRRLAEGLVDSGLRNLWISLDSADAKTHESRRGLQGVVAGIERALPIFHEAGLYPAVNLGLTRHLGVEPLPALRVTGPEEFRHRVREGLTAFFARAVDLGFSMANVCYPMSASDGDQLDPVYLATADEPSVSFTAAERVILYETLAGVIDAQRARIRVFTPLSSLDALAEEHRGSGGGAACRGGVDYFFVDPHGDTYPCGYRADAWMGPFVTFQPPKAGRPSCRRCDWECFRDPSELFAPVTSPGRLRLPAARVLAGDRRMRLWWQDVRYARACGLFDGRRPADVAALRRFAPAETPAVSDACGAPTPGRTVTPPAV
jgi:MoaA/NifB/PqqE/SkfB family radical SAM enzyme